MSNEALTWAWHESPMLLTAKGKPDTTARAVLAAMADHAHKDGTNCHPSVLLIVFRTGFDERTIQRAQDRLETAGLIERDGVTYTGTVRWSLNMSRRRPHDEWERLQASAEETKRAEAERVRAYRNRPKTIPEEERTDSASVRTDFKSVCTDATPPEP